MSDESINKELVDISTDLSLKEENSTAVEQPLTLNEESLALIEKIIAEPDEQKSRDLITLFNSNQNKKTMVRINKLSDLLDTIPCGR